jgi:hypothetical protein
MIGMIQRGASYNYLFDKKKEKLFFTVFFFFRVPKRAVLARVRWVEGGGGTSAKTALFSTRTKKQLKKVFSFFEHEVLFY